MKYLKSIIEWVYRCCFTVLYYAMLHNIAELSKNTVALRCKYCYLMTYICKLWFIINISTYVRLFVSLSQRTTALSHILSCTLSTYTRFLRILRWLTILFLQLDTRIYHERVRWAHKAIVIYIVKDASIIKRGPCISIMQTWLC